MRASVRNTNGTSLDVRSVLSIIYASQATSVPRRPAMPQLSKKPKQAKPWWRRAIRLVAFWSVSQCQKTTYANASAIRPKHRGRFKSAWVRPWRSIEARPTALSERDHSTSPVRAGVSFTDRPGGPGRRQRRDGRREVQAGRSPGPARHTAGPNAATAIGVWRAHHAATMCPRPQAGAAGRWD